MSMVMAGIRNKKLGVFLSEGFYFLCAVQDREMCCGRSNMMGNLRGGLKCDRVTVGRELTMNI